MVSQADRSDRKVGEYVREPDPKPQPQPGVIHEFERDGYAVMLAHRGNFVDRLSNWTGRGIGNAVEDAKRHVQDLDIRPGDALTVYVIHHVTRFEREYRGIYANPLYYHGSRSQAPQVAMYGDNEYNRRLASTALVWCSDPDAPSVIPKELIEKIEV